MKQRLLSILLSFVLVLGLIPAAGAAGPFLPLELDLDNGGIVITETGYTQGAGEEQPYRGPYKLLQSNPTPTANTVSVVSGEHTIIIGSTVNIDVHTKADTCAFGVESGVTLDLQLEQDLNLKSGSNKAGFQIPEGATVTISATTENGSLMAIGGENGAGIGGSNTACGNLTILSGGITAQGGSGGAGIGGAKGKAGTAENGVISIQGGQVTATGKNGGAGIGGGAGQKNNEAPGTGINGKIEIIGDAVVVATGSGTNYDAGAGVGGGSGSNGTMEDGTILISGNANLQASSSFGAAIGGGYYLYSGYNSGYYHAFEYLGDGTGTRGRIEISDHSIVKAISIYGAGIGSAGASGKYDGVSREGSGTGTEGVILITDHAQVNASTDEGAGIGGGSRSAVTGIDSVITIEKNARVSSISTSDHGIGGSSNGTGTLNLSADQILAKGKTSGIYGFGTVNISGGNLTAEGQYGIQYGTTYFYGGHAKINATSKAITSQIVCNPGGKAWVEVNPAQTSADFTSGVWFSGTEGKIYGPAVNNLVTYTLPQDLEIPEGYTLTVAEGQRLIIPKGKTLTVNGKLIVSGLLVKQGNLVTGETGLVQDYNHAHKLVNVVARAATCVEPGVISHWHCEICGLNFADQEGKQPLASVEEPINPKNHVGETQLTGAVEATCIAGGKTGDLYCMSCRGLIKASEDIAPTGHNYDENGICTECGATEDPNAATIQITGCQAAHAGEEITLEVSLRNNPGVTAVGLDVRYNGDQLKLIRVEDTGLLHAAAMDTTYEANPYGLYWADYAAKENVTANGVIARLTFEVLADCADADTWVQLSYETNNILNADAQPVAFELTNGRVTTVSNLYGDVNGDRAVDVQDIYTLGRFQANWEGYSILKKPADVNVDGAINGVDLAMLTRYVAKWPNVELGQKPALPPVLMGVQEGVITVSDGKGVAGNQVQLLVSLDQNPGLVLANLQVDYDESLLKLVSVESKDVLTNFVSPAAPQKLPYKLLWNDSGKRQADGTPAVSTKNGTMAVLTFEILSGDAAEAQVRVTCGSGDALDGYLQPVTLQSKNGRIVIDDSSKVELKATTSYKNGSTTVNVTLTDRGSGAAGTLFCAAYDKGTDRMLAISSKSGVTLRPKGSGTVTLTLDAPKDAVYRVFFVSADNNPLAKPAKGEPGGKGGGIGGDNETEILPGSGK